LIPKALNISICCDGGDFLGARNEAIPSIVFFRILKIPSLNA
jgi:hypothetical protein